MGEAIKTILIQSGLTEENVNNADYIEAELVDSLIIAEIIMALEEEFHIEILGEDIVPANFKNIHSVESLIKKYCD